MKVDLPGQHVLERTSVLLDRQVCLRTCSARSDLHPHHQWWENSYF